MDRTILPKSAKDGGLTTKGKAIFFCLLLVLALALAGCSRAQAPDVTPSTTPSHSPGTTPEADGLFDDDGEYRADSDGKVDDGQHNGITDDFDRTDRDDTHTGTDSALDRAENAADDMIGGAENAVDDMARGIGNAARDVTGR